MAVAGFAAFLGPLRRLGGGEGRVRGILHVAGPIPSHPVLSPRKAGGRGSKKTRAARRRTRRRTSSRLPPTKGILNHFFVAFAGAWVNFAIGSLFCRAKRRKIVFRLNCAGSNFSVSSRQLSGVDTVAVGVVRSP